LDAVEALALGGHKQWCRRQVARGGVKATIPIERRIDCQDGSAKVQLRLAAGDLLSFDAV